MNISHMFFKDGSKRKIVQLLPADGWIAYFGDYTPESRGKYVGYLYTDLVAWALVENPAGRQIITGVNCLDEMSGEMELSCYSSSFIGYDKRGHEIYTNKELLKMVDILNAVEIEMREEKE